MLLGHSCKVTSRQAVKINEEIYAHYQDVVDCHEFHHAIKNAKEQLTMVQDREEAYCYQKEFDLPLKRNIFGLYTIPVMVNHVQCQFIVDTGAQISGIREKRAKQLMLPNTKGFLSIGSITGSMKKMKGLNVDALQVGALEFRNKAVVQLTEQDFSLRFGKMDLFTFDGIIGWDILRTLDFELDDISKRFIVLKNRLHISHPNMLRGSFPCFIVTHPDGGTSLYGFDSGSRVSWIGENAITAHNYTITKETNGLGFGVHGMEKMEMKVVEHCKLYLDKARIELFQTMSGRTNLFPGFTFDGVFGNEICKGRRIRLINSAGMVLIA